ncbi:unnamed protein product [Closterium sp. NIES-53]
MATIMVAAASMGGQQQPLPHSDTISPQQLREWVIQQGRPGGGGYRAGGAGGAGQQQQPAHPDTLSPQQIREWIVQRGYGFMGTGQRRQQCQQETFSPQRLRDCGSQRGVPGCVEAAALGASESAAALGTSESAAALGASASTITGLASAEAFHTFTLDSGASRCFFRDCTTVTPLAAPVPVSLADPSGGPVIARASTVLPYPAVPSGALSGLHLPSFSTKLVRNAVLQDALVDTFTPGGQRVSIFTCSRTGHHLATFTRQPGSSLYTLTTASAQVAASGQVAVSSQVSTSSQLVASCSCQVLSQQTLLWHHCLGHPSLPRLCIMRSRLLVSGLPRSLPPLPRSLAPPCHPCVERRQRAAPHSSFPLTTAPLQTLHMDADVRGVLIPWIVATRHQLCERFWRDLPVMRLHSDRGALHWLDHAATPHFLWQFAVRYAAHQLNLWPRALSLVCDTNASKLSPCTLRCTFLGFPTNAPPWQFYHLRSRRVLSSQDVTFDESACFYRLHSHGSPRTPLVEPLVISSYTCGPDEGGDLAADDTATTRRSPCLETPPGFTPRASSPSLRPVAVDTGAAGGGDSGGEDAGGAGPGGAETWGAGPRGAETGGEGSGGADSGGSVRPSGGGAVGAPTAGPGIGQQQQPSRLETPSPQQLCEWVVRRGHFGARAWIFTAPRAAGPGGAGAVGAGGTRGAAVSGGGSTGGAGADGPGGAPTRGAGADGAGGAASAGGAGGATGAAGTGGAGGTAGAGGARAGGTGGTGGAGAAGPRGARTRGAGADGVGSAAGAGGAGGATAAAGTRGAGGTAGDGGARAGGTGGTRGDGAAGAGGAASAGGATRAAGARGAGAAGAGGAGAAGTVLRRPFFYPQSQSSLPPPDSVLRQVVRLPSSTGLTPPLLYPPADQSTPQQLPGYPLPAPAPHTEVTESLTERREPEPHASTPVRTRRVARPRPLVVPGTHVMAIRPSSVRQRVPLPSPLASSLLDGPDPASDLARAASPTVTRLLATVVTDPDFESTAAFSLVAELVDFAASRRLDYVASLITESESVCPPSLGGEPALGNDVLEDRQFELECFAAALPHFASMLLCLEGDLDAPDIPTPRSYAEAIAGSSSLGEHSRWHVDFHSDVATGFSACRVLLHVAAQRDYELHSLNFSTVFLQGSLHKEIWLRCPPGFTGSFPAGTQWSLRRPVYSLRQAPHHTLRTTLAALGFAPSSADPSLFLRTDTSWPLFYVLVYTDDLSTEHIHPDLVTHGAPSPSALRLPVLLAAAHSSAYWPLALSSTFRRVHTESCEAEIYARAMAAQELRWLTYMLTDLGERPRSPPVLYVDNKAMLALCHEQRLEHRMKHISLHYFLARELQMRGQLRLSFVASWANTTDVFTKALGSSDHQRYCTTLGLLPSVPHLFVS